MRKSLLWYDPKIRRDPPSCFIWRVALIAGIAIGLTTVSVAVVSSLTRLGPTRDIPPVQVIQLGLEESLRERAAHAQNAALVVGTHKGRVTNTDRNRIWFGKIRAHITVSAAYEAHYGYRLDSLDKSYRVIMSDDRLILYMRPPEVLFDAAVPTHAIRVTGESRGTALLSARDRERSVRRAMRPLARIATTDAQRRVSRSREARRLAEHTVRDVLTTFLADVHPSLARRYHDRIEIRFEDDPWKVKKVAGR